MNEHVIIVNKLLEGRNYNTILDLGSGKTSMNILLNRFPESEIDGVCYPGDHRKLDSIRENCNGKFNLIEMDICKERLEKKYNLVLCHLLLGEALKFR